MTTIWRPDTCDCVIEYTEETDAKFVSRCKEHKGNVASVFAHNRSFNERLPQNPTMDDVLALLAEKRIEKKRIRDLNAAVVTG